MTHNWDSLVIKEVEQFRLEHFYTNNVIVIR